MKGNSSTLLLPGNVFLTSLDLNPVRVIMTDDIAVFYEVWWPHVKEWSYKTNLKKRAIYYRTSVNKFMSEATYFRNELLSQEEIDVHRPDLPLFLCRNDRISWTTAKYKTMEQFEKENHIALHHTISLRSLDIGKIILVPSGPDGGLKKGITIEAKNNTSFTCTELLWNAQNIQADYISTKIEAGIGIFRQGFEKGVPTFYIGGFYDSAGLLNEAIFG